MSASHAHPGPAERDDRTDGPEKEKTPLLTTRQRIAWLHAFWKPHLRFLVFLFFFTLVSSAVAIAYPLVFRKVIDGVYASLSTSRPENATLYRLLGILGLIAIGRTIAGFYPGFRAWMNLKLEKGVRERVFGSILEKDFTFFSRFRTGDLVTRLTDDIAEYPRIAWFGCSGVFRFVDSLSKFLFCVAAMLLLDWRLALLAMIPVPLMLWVFYVARKELGNTYRKQQEAVSQTNDTIEAALSGVRIVKAFNGEAGQVHRLERILQRRIGLQLRLAKLVVLVHEMDNIASRIGQVIVLSVGGLAVLDGRLSLGTLYAFYVYLDMLIYPMMDLPNLFVTAKQAFVSIDREVEVLRHPVSTLRDGTEPLPARARRSAAPGAPEEAGIAARDVSGDGAGIARIELASVGFRYRPDLPPALDGVCFAASRGERIAIVGPVASGKSTLLRLLAGLLPAQEGEYTIDGRPFRAIEWGALRGRLGYVPQESLLFSETVQENVSFGRDADPEWVRRCLEVAQMGPDLERMKDGIATQLGQRGALVSGGQKQRIAIARALAGRPDLLLMDDCTASLDARHEDLFWNALAETFHGVTVFLVSHRLATIRRADRILVLDHGRIVDEGTHDELARRCDVYRQFLLIEQKRSHLAGEAEAEAAGAPSAG